MMTIIGVMGPGERATSQDVVAARALGHAIASRGWVLLSGGRNAGVMDAVTLGAKDGGGLTVGILPTGSKRAGVSAGVDIAIVTAMSSARNAINVLSSDVVIACGALEAGTLSEVALAIKAEREVVLLNSDAEGQRFLERVGRGRVRSVATVPEAIDAVVELLAAATG